MLATTAAVIVYSARTLGGMPKVDERATSFEGNARLKAYALHNKVSHEDWILADDSGLEVAALEDAPGIRSARYAGDTATDAAHNAKLLQALHAIEDRQARFVCYLAFLNRCHEFIFKGICKGHIAHRPRGHHGFGYDPLFIPEGYDQTFAELSSEQKHTLSHRAKAMGRLAEWIKFLPAFHKPHR